MGIPTYKYFGEKYTRHVIKLKADQLRREIICICPPPDSIPTEF